MNLPSNSPHPSLSQVDSLLHVLKDVGAVKEHWDLDNSYDTFVDLSLAEYRYLVAIVLDRKVGKINKKLLELGIKRKPISSGENYTKTPKGKLF